ncbi:Zinc finger CCCH domain-containing protein 32 [Camellia lanceoleosa]|uniref:Zinc finger CCCH domain-containing protein 32 n=1 Tax=Camellia lanceoleosa TaxID=1840588 RepID=A0ACC0I6J7_9ERIC|nr:Zinc finger CCCH domain-containing protein 32 [Camellia lanceoleosa]
MSVETLLLTREPVPNFSLLSCCLIFARSDLSLLYASIVAEIDLYSSLMLPYFDLLLLGFRHAEYCSDDLPLWGVQPCAFYLQNGYCKFGRTCKFDHPMGTGLTPIQVECLLLETLQVVQLPTMKLIICAQIVFYGIKINSNKKQKCQTSCDLELVNTKKAISISLLGRGLNTDDQMKHLEMAFLATAALQASLVLYEIVRERYCGIMLAFEF